VESFYRTLQEQVTDRCATVSQNLAWLASHMPAYFTITMGPETEALARLALHLPTVKDQNSLVLLDRAGKLILARRDRAGSLYETLQALGEREVAYSEIIHSNAPLPGTDTPLEIQRFEFQPSDGAPVSAETPPPAAVSPRIRSAVAGALARDYPDFPPAALDAHLTDLWRQKPDYVDISPPERIARILWVLHQTGRRSGFFFDVQPVAAGEDGEWRVVFGVAQPPRRQFLLQILEVFRRLDLGVRRSYSLTLTRADGPCFIGNFYIRAHDRSPIDATSDIYRQLKTELYNTQILAIESFAYRNFVAAGAMTGPDASLAEAMVAFCYTNLSHGQPDRFDLDTVRGCFESHPDILAMLVDLFRLRFDPQIADRQSACQDAQAAAEATVAAYNTGQRYLDEIRRVVFDTALKMVRHCLKTNFFVPEKHALAFRLDPAYLGELAPELRRDLPEAAPFRITFFFGRHGFGYHIGFSDIARGGWRTVLCRSGDECTSAGNTLFREVFVLAHTQHLKNKDIYEGGSKMTAICDVRDLTAAEDVTRRLHKFQYGLINAFLDIFVTDGGAARHPAVVDYHREEEPIELGPDENMHDEMIETIARLAVERGYVLGAGIISSKQVGINHKTYGVTSRGVIRTAEIALRQVGIDMARDAFTVKMTGGPFGDVAGNSLRLLLDRCPRVRIVAMVDGSGGFFDPRGADPGELDRIVLKADLDRFDPQRLHPGGFIVFRTQQRREAMRQLHRKLLRTESGIEEQWITADAFFNETNRLVFEKAAALFLPCGGRPETIDATNWSCYFGADGAPSARVIVEGANSFISPEARNALQDRGVILVRDASANKCGVICSSYEIIANLLLSDEEFLADKEAYVSDVLEILTRRASDEAELIFSRHRQAEGRRRFTEISVEISQEINQWYARLFAFFQAQPALAREADFRRLLLSHLPAFIERHDVYRNRPDRLPEKIKYAILAVEIATRIVYRGGWAQDFENRLRSYVKASVGQAVQARP
jgi:glutamate dehydrogenase